MSRILLLVPIVALALGCGGPVWMLPGGALSGDVRPAPEDWSAMDQEVVQLEVRPRDPYSVNVWGVGLGASYYVAAGRGGESAWATAIEEDADVRLRVGGGVYELRASRIEDEPERERFLAALREKYDYEPDPEDRAQAWLFRLEPR